MEPVQQAPPRNFLDRVVYPKTDEELFILSGGFSVGLVYEVPRSGYMAKGYVWYNADHSKRNAVMN